MSSLSGAISVAVNSLAATEMELQNAANNIANINTPGYARRQVVLKESTPLSTTPYATPAGVTVNGIQSIRDTVLELRVAAQTSQYQKDHTVSNNLSSVETLFSEGTGSVGDSVTTFFTSLSSLATNPSDSTLRANVLSAASNVTTSVSTLYNQLKSQQDNVNASVRQSVDKVNTLTSQIAAINVQVADLEKLGQDTGTLGDQRTDLVNQLSALVNVTVVQGNSALTIQTANGSQLVVGEHSYNLGVGVNSNGQYGVIAQGEDITSNITGGSLGGLLEVRDSSLPSLMNQLDSFAYNFSNAVNAAQAAGYEKDGTAGATDTIFTTPTMQTGAAASMSVSMTNGTKLAISSLTDGSGSGNLATLTAVKSAAIASTGVTYGGFYSSIVQSVGAKAQTSNALASADSATLDQMKSVLNQTEGVSIDEEATDLIRFQQAYQAAARVVNIISELSKTLIQMGA